MAAYLGRFTKQSAEVRDYDVDYTDYFVGRSDAPASFAVTVAAGITLVTSARTGNVVKVVLSDGVNGGQYKVTVRLTTTSGIVREIDFLVRVRDI